MAEDKLYKAIMESLPVSIYFKDKELKYRYLSRIAPEVAKAAGPSGVIGKRIMN